MEAHTAETGGITGTKDKDYNLIWFVEQCLSNALRLETYIRDAEREGDSDLAEFFRRAQSESRKGAEQGQGAAPPAPGLNGEREVREPPARPAWAPGVRAPAASMSWRSGCVPFPRRPRVTAVTGARRPSVVFRGRPAVFP